MPPCGEDDEEGLYSFQSKGKGTGEGGKGGKGKRVSRDVSFLWKVWTRCCKVLDEGSANE